MNFVKDIEPAEYDAFVRNHPTKSHFMQSYAWGEFCRVEKDMEPHYVGMRDDEGRLVCAALLLSRKPTGLPHYFYSPRGYVIDFDDRDMLREFTGYVKDFAKEEGAMFVAIDPDIERWEIDEHGKHTGGFDNSWLVDYLKELGYRHMGFNQMFDGRQPRYTFRINLDREVKDIEKSIVGNVMKNVRKSHNYASEVTHGTVEDTEILYRMLCLTGERDNFDEYPESYYRNFFKILAEHDMATLYLGTTYPAKTVEMLENSLEELLKQREKLKKPGPVKESHITEERLRRQIEQFKEYAAEYPEGTTISAHLVVNYGDKSWAVHAGSDNILKETFLNNRVYYEKLMDQRAKGSKILDQFGTVGDWENSPLRSLHEFKKQWGGRYVEFVGEFNLVTRPAMYMMYRYGMPVYRKLRKLIGR